jgi:hypothetical protein
MQVSLQAPGATCHAHLEGGLLLLQSVHRVRQSVCGDGWMDGWDGMDGMHFTGLAMQSTEHKAVMARAWRQHM